MEWDSINIHMRVWRYGDYAVEQMPYLTKEGGSVFEVTKNLEMIGRYNSLEEAASVIRSMEDTLV